MNNEFCILNDEMEENRAYPKSTSTLSIQYLIFDIVPKRNIEEEFISRKVFST